MEKLTVLEFLTLLNTPKTGVDAKNRRSRSKSTWVLKYGYVLLSDDRKGLLVIFHPFTVIFYPYTSMYQYAEMSASESKGRWIHNHIYTNPYEILDSSSIVDAIHNY
jgi:hypothetical protein